MIALKIIHMRFLVNISEVSHISKFLTITKDPKFTHYKKFAQFIGIKAAKNEILLFTDADCKPHQTNGLKE